MFIGGCRQWRLYENKALRNIKFSIAFPFTFARLAAVFQHPFRVFLAFTCIAPKLAVQRKALASIGINANLRLCFCPCLCFRALYEEKEISLFLLFLYLGRGISYFIFSYFRFNSLQKGIPCNRSWSYRGPAFKMNWKNQKL